VPDGATGAHAQRSNLDLSRRLVAMIKTSPSSFAALLMAYFDARDETRFASATAFDRNDESESRICNGNVRRLYR